MIEWIERGSKVIMNTYSQFPVVIEKGNGVYLWDSEGKKYLDFSTLYRLDLLRLVLEFWGLLSCIAGWQNASSWKRGS